MRFQSWDVLLFPAHDGTPLQEFKPEYHIAKDSDQTFFAHMTVDSRPDDMLVRPESKGLHTVSSYIPMLQPGTRYQISIHSWKKPEMTAGDPQSMIEARIFVNGAPVTYVVSPMDSAWPLVIDNYPGRITPHIHQGFTTDLDLVVSSVGPKKRNLVFPAFSQDCLQQWGNKDTELGHIKIIISEGVASQCEEGGEVSYMRLNNIVAFQYRYAPQEFLESVGIYYPCTHKYDNSFARWFPMTIPQAHLGSPSSGSSSIQHSHSPTRRPVNDGPPPPAFDLIASSGSTSRSSGNRNSAVDGYNTLAPGFEDTNMPDYTNSRKGIETSSPVSPEDGNHFPCSTARAINMAEMQRAIASVPSLSRSKTEHGIAEDIPRMIHQELANGAQLDNCDIQKANVHSKKPSVQIGLDSNFHKQLRDIIEEVTVQRPLDADLESPSSKDILMVTPRSRSGSEPLGELGNFQ